LIARGIATARREPGEFSEALLKREEAAPEFSVAVSRARSAKQGTSKRRHLFKLLVFLLVFDNFAPQQ
jgi:hypothetical protein